MQATIVPLTVKTAQSGSKRCLTALNRTLIFFSQPERSEFSGDSQVCSVAGGSGYSQMERVLDGCGNGPALRDLSVKEKGGLAQGGLQVEGFEGGGGVFGDNHFEPPEGGAGGGVMDADVGDRATDDQSVYVPDAQEMVQVRAVEGVVADLTDDELVLQRPQLVHYLPSPAIFADVLRPDLPLRVPLIVRILCKDDLHPGLPSEVEEALNRGYRGLCVRDDERASLLHEVVLHVHNDKGRLRRVYLDLFVHLVLRNFYSCVHRMLLLPSTTSV